MFFTPTVGIASSEQPWEYPTLPPFRPDETYIELGGRVPADRERNICYRLFRQLAKIMRWDSPHDSSSNWNPLGYLICPGQRVVVKPNLVRHIHMTGGDYQVVVTHASVVRCVLDYVALALQGRGEITGRGCPVQGADFDAILSRTGLREVCADVAKTWDIPVYLADFRLWSVELDDDFFILRGHTRDGDPRGYRWINLGERSLLNGISDHCHRFRVTKYDAAAMILHHNSSRHEYIVPQTILDADVVVTLPKLKTHHKVGLTAAPLKTWSESMGIKTVYPITVAVHAQRWR